MGADNLPQSGFQDTVLLAVNGIVVANGHLLGLYQQGDEEEEEKEVFMFHNSA